MDEATMAMLVRARNQRDEASLDMAKSIAAMQHVMQEAAEARDRWRIAMQEISKLTDSLASS